MKNRSQRTICLLFLHFLVGRLSIRPFVGVKPRSFPFRPTGGGFRSGSPEDCQQIIPSSPIIQVMLSSSSLNSDVLPASFSPTAPTLEAAGSSSTVGGADHAPPACHVQSTKEESTNLGEVVLEDEVEEAAVVAQASLAASSSEAEERNLLLAAPRTAALEERMCGGTHQTPFLLSTIGVRMVHHVEEGDSSQPMIFRTASDTTAYFPDVEAVEPRGEPSSPASHEEREEEAGRDEENNVAKSPPRSPEEELLDEEEEGEDGNIFLRQQLREAYADRDYEGVLSCWANIPCVSLPRMFPIEFVIEAMRALQKPDAIIESLFEDFPVFQSTMILNKLLAHFSFLLDIELMEIMLRIALGGGASGFKPDAESFEIFFSSLLVMQNGDKMTDWAALVPGDEYWTMKSRQNKTALGGGVRFPLWG